MSLFPSVLEIWNILERIVSLHFSFICDNRNTSPLSLLVLIRAAAQNDSALSVSYGSCLMVGKKKPTAYHTCNNTPKGAYFWGETSRPVLVWNHQPPSTRAQPSHPVFHLIFLILFWFHIIIFEWVIITISVSKWNMNTLRIVSTSSSTNSLLSYKRKKYDRRISIEIRI